MANFYFTYGTSKTHPFYGGWTKVTAPDRASAEEIFIENHPCRDGLINCASIYEENYFVTTNMFKNGNFGYRCHEELQ